MSEIALLRQRIETECRAMQQALHGYAVVARHDIIARRFASIGQHKEQLAAVVGEQEAVRITCQIYTQVVEAHD